MNDEKNVQKSIRKATNGVIRDVTYNEARDAIRFAIGISNNEAINVPIRNATLNKLRKETWGATLNATYLATFSNIRKDEDIQ